MALVLPGCPDDEPMTCGRHMAFHLLIAAEPGPLPDDTEVEIKHGTGTEDSGLDAPFPDSDVVYCCRSTLERECVEPVEGGDGHGGSQPAPEALLCELWTDGPARVTVTASGYPRLEENLESRTNEGCIQTTDATVTLRRGDAGP